MCVHVCICVCLLQSPENLNMHGVLLHLLGDALGSVGVIVRTLFLDMNKRMIQKLCMQISALIILYGGSSPNRLYVDPVSRFV